MKIELESRGKIMTIKEELDRLENVLDERGYWTEEERERYQKLSQEESKDSYMTDEELLAFLKEQAASGFGQLAGDYTSFDMNDEHPKFQSIFEEIAELEERIAKKNASKN